MSNVIDRRYRVGKARFVPSMGEAFDAFDLEKQRPITIWLLPKIRPSLAKIFFAKNESAANLRSNFTPKICNQGIDNQSGQLFVVFERIQVETLESVLQDKKKLSQDSALKLFVHLLQALMIFHNTDIVHGRLSPMNLLVIKDDGMADDKKIIGFGLNYIQKISDTSSLLLPYLAPEQVLDDIESASADLYAAGMILYRSIIGESLLLPDESDLPPDINPLLRPIINKLLAHDPANRYLMSENVLNDLKERGLVYL